MTPITKVTPAVATPAPSPKLDAVAAKAVLDKFAEAHKASRDLAEALETAVAYERREMELKNNLEHLEKQQVALVEADVLARQEAQQAAQAQKARLATELGAIQAEIRKTAEALRVDQAAAKDTLRQEQAAFDRFLAEAAGARNQIEHETAAKQAELAAINKRIAEAKDKMKVFLA